MLRKYQRIQELLPQIEVMLQHGMSHHKLGLSGGLPIHTPLKRVHRKERAGIPQKLFSE